MKKSEKRLISVSLVIAIVACIFSIGINAYAKAERLMLDVLYSDTISGSEDLIWYVYTPEISGTYSFLSFNVPRSEAYLFTKEVSADQDEKVMTQLAYNSLNPDFEERGQGGIGQFCLTYHLEAGKTYYYAAGWWSSERTSGTMKVKLVCDSYDSEVVEKIDLSSGVSFEENTNGTWETDAEGEEYYSYNYSRIISNLTVKVTYKDGSTSSVTGADEIDGHSISYSVNQNENHWYPETDERYTGNVITVTVMGFSEDYNAVITPKAYKSVKLKVVDYSTNSLLKDVTLECDGQSAVTDVNGVATINLMRGDNTVVLTGENVITRKVTVNPDMDGSSVNFTSKEIGVVTGDFNGDSVINGKDYSYILKNFTENDLLYEKIKFKKQINFKAEDYPALTIRPN